MGVAESGIVTTSGTGFSIEDDLKIRTALVSVFDKTGLVPFVERLVAQWSCDHLYWRYTQGS